MKIILAILCAALIFSSCEDSYKTPEEVRQQAELEIEAAKQKVEQEKKAAEQREREKPYEEVLAGKRDGTIYLDVYSREDQSLYQGGHRGARAITEWQFNHPDLDIVSITSSTTSSNAGSGLLGFWITFKVKEDNR